MRALAILLTAASLVALASAPAHAARVRVDGNTLKIDNGNLEANTFSLTRSGALIVVRDSTRDLNAAAGCIQVDARSANCTAGGVTRVEADLGSNDDTFSTELSLPAAIEGGIGDDVLNGGPAADVINAGTGSDRLDGKGGDDTMNGEFGEDTLLAGPGTDNFNGGNGVAPLLELVDFLSGVVPADVLVYGGRTTTGVTVTLDDQANDGQPGENDNAEDIESVIGTVFSDTLSGNGASNALVGTPKGLSPRSSAVHDTIDAKGGRDLIDARGGTNDAIGCGDGADGAAVDLVDPLATSCEDVQQAAVGQHPIVDIRKVRIRGGRAGVTLVCPKGGRRTCSGTLTVRAGSKRLGRARYRLRRGREDQVTVQLGRGSRRGLTVVATGRDREGEPTTTLFRVR